MQTATVISLWFRVASGSLPHNGKCENQIKVFTVWIRFTIVVSLFCFNCWCPVNIMIVGLAVVVIIFLWFKNFQTILIFFFYL